MNIITMQARKARLKKVCVNVPLKKDEENEIKELNTVQS